jgi:HK97 family phage major capsid protein
VAAENLAFTSGDGSGKPKGFLTYAAGTAWGQIERVKTGVDGNWPTTAPADKLVELYLSLKSGYAEGAVWMLNRTLLADIRRFKATDNSYIWQPGLNGAAASTLLGYPVIINEDMPARASGSLSVAFGNFRRGYTVVDRTDLRILRDPFTAKPYVVFYATKRVGGDVSNFEAIKLLHFAV